MAIQLPPQLPTSRAELVARFNRGETFKFLHFWGHKPSADGRVSAACLSQWFEAPFQVDGVAYQTAEHYMMAAKARLFDPSVVPEILAAASPGAAKALGRKVRGFDEAVWVDQRFKIVCEANFAKFGQHPPLQKFLAETGTKILVEASPFDRIWGIGMAAHDPGADDPNQWKGLNLLGFALMEARGWLGLARATSYSPR